MTTSCKALVATENASRYVQQLCKHWSHKFESTFDENEGRVGLPFGIVHLAVVEGGLAVSLEITDPDNVQRARQVVAEHLDRFAFREAPLTFTWAAA